MKHLRFDLSIARDKGVTEHAYCVMLGLGITYQHATPQSIAEQWWFWNCENVPDCLPGYLSALDLNPIDCIGYGLSAEKAAEISNYKKPIKQKPL